MAYDVKVADSVKKSWRRIPTQDRQRILEALRALADAPRPRGCVALRGSVAAYRIRLGDYRALYDVDDAAKIVTVLAVKHRREAYRDL